MGSVLTLSLLVGVVLLLVLRFVVSLVLHMHKQPTSSSVYDYFVSVSPYSKTLGEVGNDLGLPPRVLAPTLKDLYEDGRIASRVRSYQDSHGLVRDDTDPKEVAELSLFVVKYDIQESEEGKYPIIEFMLSDTAGHSTAL